MTWLSAKAAAAEYLRWLDERFQWPRDLTGATMRLADYETEGDLKFLKGHAEWPLEFHRMVNSAMARDLRKRGATVEIVPLKMTDYFDWLATEKLANTAANRAKFITLKTS